MLTNIIYVTIFLMFIWCEYSYTLSWKNGSIERKKQNNKFNIFFFIILGLFAGLRYPGTGTDTAQYYVMYRNILQAEQVPLSDYWGNVVNALKDGTYTDGLFWSFFSKLMSYIIRNPQLWLAFVSMLFLSGVLITIKRYSKDSVLSWAYIFSVFVFAFILQGLRQSIAMFFVLLSFKPLKDGKLIRFLAFLAIAYLFHQSAMIFVVMYPLRKYKPNKYTIVIAFAIMVIANIMPGVFKGLLQNFAEDTRFDGYLKDRDDIYTLTGWFVLFAIYIFCYFCDTREKNDDNNLLFTVSLVGLITQSMVGIVAEMFRVSMYFNMFNMLLIPNTMQKLHDSKSKNSMIYRFAVLAAFMFYCFASGLFRYLFFWQREIRW